jgi:DMSO/TMAO reductase YedYZ molybdopterin-dependent catalytic subunit
MPDAFSYRSRGFYGRIPSEPHQLTEQVTSTKDCIVLCHLGVLDVHDGDSWQLDIGGLVGRPLGLTVRNIKEMPKTVVESVHQCAGSPLAPEKPTQRVCNVTWGGVRLDHVLRLAEADPQAAFVWATGADSGAFGGVECGRYIKDLPRWRAGTDVLLAYEMNGEALLPEHGYPLRLVVPGFYATNSVKWLRRLELRNERAPGPFTTRWYNDVEADGSTRPVWKIAPQSVIVWPPPNAKLERGSSVCVWGWAWGADGVSAVDVSADGGCSWTPSRLVQSSEHSWLKFSCDLTIGETGTELTSRATSAAGDRQPDHGQRNGLYIVPIVIV